MRAYIDGVIGHYDRAPNDGYVYEYNEGYDAYCRVGTRDNSWDDLRFPSQGINPPGQVNDPDIDIDGTLLFDEGRTELIAGIAQMPHTWVEGTAIKPHIHWMKTTSAAGDVVWQFAYRIADPGDVFPAFSDWITATPAPVSPGDVADTHGISSFGSLDMTGFKISCIIIWKLQRVGGDEGDTYGADAKLLEFDIHYRNHNYGSRQEYIK